jgi:glycosyltransferase involved in cell wall biosynthesis
VSRSVARHPGLRVVVIARLDNAKLQSKVEPLLDIDDVAEVVVVRRHPLPLDGVRSVCPPAALARDSWSAEPWRLATLLRETARAPERTVVVSFYLMPHGLFADWARRLTRVPTIQMLIGDEDVVRAETSPFFRAAIESAHAVGLRGPRSLERIAALGLPRARLFCPPNVYDVSAFRPDPRVAQDVDVVFVGRFYGSKRLDVLLEAAAAVRARRGAIKVALVGDGRDRPAVEALVQRFGLSANVVVTGTLAAPEIAHWLRRSRLFVMTSEQEGLPMAMIEAMTCGVPVVIGDIGDVTSVAHHEVNAWIVGERTPTAFADAIVRLLDDDALRARLARGAAAMGERFDREYTIAAAREAWRPVLARLRASR